MPYRLLLDENLEHEVLHRLENYGHDVEHVETVPQLGKGTTDDSIAAYSRETDRIIVTYDDDFVLGVSQGEYRGVFYVGNAKLTTKEVADVIQAVSRQYPQSEVDGLEYLGTQWL